MILKEITAAGKDVQEALANGKAALGVGELDEIKFEIIDGGTKGILGLFSRPAKVRVYIQVTPASKAVAFMETVLVDMGLTAQVSVKEEKDRSFSQ